MIEINSLHFDIEQGDSCQYDSVKIYDGETTNATILGQVNGYCWSGPSDLTSTGNAVLITFVSNNFLTYPGFVITYKGKWLFTSSSLLYPSQTKSDFIASSESSINRIGSYAEMIDS